MKNISLTSAMSMNLLSLKQTSSAMSEVQNRLATGLKVNSAIDNPSAYYTAVSLNNRASDLNSLLDNMGQAIQTVKAAVEGVNTATAFLEQMQSITEQAIAEPIELETPLEELKVYTITADMSTAEIQALITEGAKLVLADDITLTEELKIDVDNVTIEGNGHQMSYAFSSGNNLLTINGSNTKIDNINFYVDADATGGYVIYIESGDNVKITNFEINTQNSSDSSVVTGISAYRSNNVKMNNFKIQNVQVGVDSYNSDIKMTNFEISATIGPDCFGVFCDEARIIMDSDAGINVPIGSKTQNHDGELTIDSSLIWDDSESEFPTDDENSKGSENIGVAAEWSKAFNDVLKQYDMLVDDASYKGVNLLKGEQLNVVFNEDKSSRLNILGKDIHSSSLGLSAAEWKTVDDVNVAVADLKRCVATLRSLSGELGNNYSVVQNRQDFTENLINILTEGADKLTLADMNEESAVMLSLQTRQQLAINSLSLASQASQSVLRLFA